MKLFFSILVLVAAMAGCRRVDERTFTIDLPGAKESDVQEISRALMPYAGVNHSSVKFDMSTHKLTLKYDSMQIAKKNIEMAIARTGFAANGVTPESIGAKSK